MYLPSLSYYFSELPLLRIVQTKSSLRSAKTIAIHLKTFSCNPLNQESCGTTKTFNALRHLRLPSRNPAKHERPTTSTNMLPAMTLGVIP